MNSLWRGRVLFLVLFINISGYEVPDVKFELLKPNGFQASVPDIPGEITFFVFQGHVNRAIKEGQVGSLTGEILKPEGGLWIYKNRDIKLQNNDVINYYIVIVHKGQRYTKENLKFTVSESPVPNPRNPVPGTCTASLTRVRGSSTPPCSGEVIFEENFDSLDENKWQRQHYIPVSDYGYPFVSYQAKAVTVSNGNLVTTSSLQKDQRGYNSDKIYTGTLDLFNGCTGPEDSCYIQANGWDILPPVVSGKVSTKEFAFTYGLIEVRAKMPIGDWLYSEIHLESFAEKFGGFNKVTKLMKIASTRGNELQSDGCGNTVLYGGLIVSPKCRDKLLLTKNNTGNWGEDYHLYSAEWRPDKLILRVDGEEWGRVEGKIQDSLGANCGVPTGIISGSVDMAPFDTHYYISLGVAAGGVTEFTDGITVGVNRKPWKNHETKAKLKFWRHQNRWKQTWKEPHMLIDYVKVTAL